MYFYRECVCVMGPLNVILTAVRRPFHNMLCCLSHTSQTLPAHIVGAEAEGVQFWQREVMIKKDLTGSSKGSKVPQE